MTNKLKKTGIGICTVYTFLYLLNFGFWKLTGQTPSQALTVVNYPDFTATSRLDGCDPTYPCIDNRSQFIRQSSTSSFRVAGTGTFSVTMQYADNPTPTIWSNFGSTAVVTNAGPSSGIGYGIGPTSITKPYHDFIRFVITGNATIMNYNGTRMFWWLPSVASIGFPISISQGGTGSQYGLPINAQAFGALCNGSHDDGPAINLALAQGVDVILPSQNCTGDYYVNSFAGTYSNNSWVFILQTANQAMFGTGPNATIQMGNGLVNSGGQMYGGGMFLLGGSSAVSGVQLHDFTIDMNGANNLVPMGQTRNAIAISGHGASNIRLYNMTFENASGQNYVTFDSTSSNVQASNLWALGGGTCLSSNTNQTDFSAFYSEAPQTNWTGLNIQQCPGSGYDSYPRTAAGGVEIHGSDSSLTDSVCEKCFPGAYLSPPVLTQTLYGGRISNLTCTLCYSGIIEATGTVDRATISDNTLNIAFGSWPSYVRTNFGSVGIEEFAWADPSLYMIMTNSTISGNVITETEASEPSVAAGTGINIGAGSGNVVCGNSITNLSGNAIYVSGTGYGFTNTTFCNNLATNFGMNTGANGHDAFDMVFSGTQTCPGSPSAPCSNYQSFSGINWAGNSAALTTATVPASGGFLVQWGANSTIGCLGISGSTFANVIPLVAGQYGSSNPCYVQTQWDQYNTSFNGLSAQSACPGGFYASAQNLFLQSNTAATSPWMANDLTVTNATTTDPCGGATAMNITSSTPMLHALYQTVTLTPGASYTVSWSGVNNGGGANLFASFYCTTTSTYITDQVPYTPLTGSFQTLSSSATIPVSCTGSNNVDVYPIFDDLNATLNLYAYNFALCPGLGACPGVITTTMPFSGGPLVVTQQIIFNGKTCALSMGTMECN